MKKELQIFGFNIKEKGLKFDFAFNESYSIRE